MKYRTTRLIAALAVTATLGLSACEDQNDTGFDVGSGDSNSNSNSDAGGGSYTMPDLRGGDLQTAQDTIQSITGNPLFVTRSVDATGLDRLQMWDSNWQVCDQDPKSGATFTDDSIITFYVVKIGEGC